LRRTGVAFWIFLLAAPCLCPAEESSSISKSVPAVQDQWLARDKARHLLASFMLTGAAMYHLHFREGWTPSESRIAGAGVTFGLGLAKEWRDLFKPEPYNRFSWKDMVADLAGIGLGILFLEWW
jgi:uncharacterized protein YfiM (DUF2279 family)